MILRFSLMALMVFGLAACESGYKRTKVVTPQRLSCTGDIPATLTLYANHDAALNFEGKSYNLERVESTSGVKYANKNINIQINGISAIITRKEGAMTHCMFMPKPGL
jgi:membrane-bound inhibitor of C-type lysozyme